MSWSQDRARELLRAAGFEAGRARALSLGENAVFALAEGPVAKVGRAPELAARAEHELRVADWLAGRQVPAVRPARPEPLLVDGHPVTLWEPLPDAVRPPGAADLAALLRVLHALPDPPFPLPRRDLLGGVERWLRLAGPHIDPADAAFLRHRRDEFAAAVCEVKPVMSPGPVHGDALPRNVWVGPNGPVLLDLETVSHDLREHDLVVMALARDRYGLPEPEYRAFTDTYGWDVAEWDGALVLRGARETAGAAWIAQHVPGDPRALAEFRRRVASLREGDTRVRWQSF
ncbi:aminoglycoside phosphotransferase family protein [Streptomyces capparidis]